MSGTVAQKNFACATHLRDKRRVTCYSGVVKTQTPLILHSLLAASVFLTSCSMLKRDPLPVYTGQAKNMLILDMGSASESSTALLTQIVVNDNDFRSRFNVIDRETINALLKDQQLASVGIINESTVARLGKQSGVQVLLKSNLNYLETASNTGGTAKSGYYTYYTAKAQVALSVLDVETGQILVTATGTGGSSDRSNDSSLRTEAFTEAVENAIYSLILSHSKLR